jgi:tRNA pseudouridine32 synthase / 23S rRNA pseudouridine746 synthase
MATPPPIKPPDRDGLSASEVSLPVGDWPTFLDFLVERFPTVKRAEWAARMGRVEVFDERGATVLPSSAYRAGERLFYYRSVAHEPPIPFAETIVFQDEFIVVADKPHFLPVTPAGRYVRETLLARLKQRLNIDTLAPAHRIDRDTAGLVLFTVQPSTRGAYQKLFSERHIEKIYEAIAPYRSDLQLPITYRSCLVESAAFMQMQETAGEPNAETQISLLAVEGDWARYELRPHTGKKHQLRAHLCALAIPIANDRIYPELKPDSGANEGWDRPLKLLAKSIAFIDPVSGESRRFVSERRLDF